MAIITIGLNHKTAPVAIRERVSFPTDELQSILQRLTTDTGLNEVAILSTCNRTELFCCSNDDQDQRGNVIDWFHHYHGLDPDEITPYLYTHPDRKAVQHLLRVASGLDSLILGEPQILGQLKDAYLAAKQAGTLGQCLNRLFEHTFQVAKQVRTDTAIGSSPVSVAFAAVSLAKQIFSRLEGQTALLIGAGETIELVARHLRENAIDNIIIANRTLARAENLVNEVNGMAITLQEIPEHLAQADIVITSTASPLPILGKGAVERAIRQRKHRPILMVDIAVPRDVEPEVAELDDAYLYTVDDLQQIIDEGLKSRQEAALQAEEIIEAQVAHFMGWLRSLDSVMTIRNYRESVMSICEQQLQQARQMIATGQDPDIVLSKIVRAIGNKLAHQPTVQMKRASFEGRTELLDAARELLGIKDSG